MSAQKKLKNIERWAALIHKLGLIIGVPAAIGILIFYYKSKIDNINEKHELDIKQYEGKIVTLQNKIDILELTQAERLLSLLESQKKEIEMERALRLASIDSMKLQSKEAVETEKQKQRNIYEKKLKFLQSNIDS